MSTFCERWENGNIRFIYSNYVAKKSLDLPQGSYYSFYSNGNPMSYRVTDSMNRIVGTSYMFHKNGMVKTCVKRNKDTPNEHLEFNSKGKLIRHLKFLNGRHHGEQYYCVDGKEVTDYYYKGVLGIDPNIAEHPELITKELVIGETNAEVRRVYLDLIGVENFLTFFDYAVLDIDVNRNDILYQIDVGDFKIHMVKFICPSTDDVYFHFVPPDCHSIGRAKCWMFGIEGEVFEPVAEA